MKKIAEQLRKIAESLRKKEAKVSKPRVMQLLQDVSKVDKLSWVSNQMWRIGRALNELFKNVDDRALMSNWNEIRDFIAHKLQGDYRDIETCIQNAKNEFEELMEKQLVGQR